MLNRLRTYLSIALTVILLVLVLHQVGIEELKTTLLQADLKWIAISFVVGQTLILISSYKWKLLLRSQNIDLPVFYLFRLYLVGTFFNHFLPTNVGGDIVRGYEAGKQINDLATGVASVFIERLTGFLILVLVAWVSFLTHLHLIHDPLLTVVMLIAIVGLAGVAWMALDARLLNYIERRIPSALLQKYLGKFRKFQTALHRYSQHRRALLLALGLSLVFYTGAIFYTYVAAQAFYQPISFPDMVFVVPITMIVAMMPFTFNGIGLQEWAYVLLFPLVGLPASAALSAIILIRTITLTSAIAGALFYLQLKARGQLPSVEAAG